jgi:hypothetical protein
MSESSCIDALTPRVLPGAQHLGLAASTTYCSGAMLRIVEPRAAGHELQAQ